MLTTCFLAIKRVMALISITLSIPLAHATAVNQVSHDGIAYLLFSAPNKIERFDLNNNQALPPINLSKSATAFVIHSNIAYIGFQRELRAINLNTLESEFIRNFSDNIDDIEIIGDAIYVFTATGYNGTTTVLSITDYSLITEFERSNSGKNFTAGKDAYYFRNTGVSPSDINKQSVNQDGSIPSGEFDSPYHGAYPDASHIWVSPDDSRAFDNSGTVYFTEGLTLAGSLGGSFTTMTFVKGNPVIARGNHLFLFTNHLIEAGSLQSYLAPNFLASIADFVYAFNIGNENYTVEKLDTSNFELPNPGAPLDGSSTNFSFDRISSDNNNVVYILDSALLSIFRWSTIESKYLQSWPLLNPPSWMSYVAAHQRIYLGYSSGKITYFDASAENANETHFATLSGAVLGLTDAGQFLFAADPSGAWGSFFIFAKDGTLIDSDDWKNAASNEYVWSSATDRVYHYRDNTSPNDIEWTAVDPNNGILGDEGDSIYHGDTLSTRYPIRLNPTGDVLLNGAGQLISANELRVINSLSNNISDAAWVNSQLFTISSESRTLQTWSDSYELLNETIISNIAPTAIKELGGKLLIIGYSEGKPNFLHIELGADSDNDGTEDLIDNCRTNSNADQADFDGDGIGDSCDRDSDNDGIDNDTEVANNLDPLNADDAEGDLDNDGYSNRTEFISGSDLFDPLSLPIPITTYNENFELGWPSGFYKLTGTAVVAPGGESNSLGLHIASTPGLPSVAFTALFSEGILSFRASSLAPWYNAPSIEVFIDDVSVVNTSQDEGAWNTITLSIEAGVHTIAFGTNLSVYGGENERIIIDNITFIGDEDSDGILDDVDNCPHTSNPLQLDFDLDGQGDECDPYPSNPTSPNDSDGDGIENDADNCPDSSNSDQQDIDLDGIGDACDLTDNRPVDSDLDGIQDNLDNCLNTANPTQEDIDNDGIGDACDSVNNRPNDNDDSATDGDEESTEQAIPTKDFSSNRSSGGSISLLPISLLFLLLLPFRRRTKLSQ